MIFTVNNRKGGFTLIEIIVVLAIMGILSSVVFSIFSFSNNIFFSGNKQHNVQNDVRSGIDIISKKLRFATEVKIIDVATSEGEIASHKPYNYIYVKDHTIKMAAYNNSTHLHSIQTLGVSGVISDTNNIFTFVDASTLGIELSGVYGVKNYQASTNIALKNFAIIKPRPVIEGTSGLAVRYNNNILSTPIAPYADLSDFEKNVLNIINPLAEISICGMVFSPNDNILIQCKSIDFSGLVQGNNNINGNIAISADKLYWGVKTISLASFDAILDVKEFVGEPKDVNSSTYGPDDFTQPSWGQVKTEKWHKISQYPSYSISSSIWNYLFETSNKLKIKSMTVRPLKENINFNDKLINPTLDIKKIHYLSGLNNEIKDNQLPDYRGVMNSVVGTYDYIICHGPLKIDATDTQNGKFNFSGIIYCDDVVTINYLDFNFNGIIIAKGLKTTGNNNNKFNVKYMKVDGEINSFNTMISNITN